jgi:hypothetical protein
VALNIRVRVDDKAVRDGLRASRRNIREDIKRTFDASARRHTLPVARALAPGVISATMTTKGTTSGAWLGTTARGQKRAIVALLNFGGTVSTPILPKRAKALHFGGRFAASVRTPRHYRGKHFMEAAVRATLTPFSRDVERQLTAIIQARVDSGGSHSGFTFASTFGGG